jgi:hypothetical protein
VIVGQMSLGCSTTGKPFPLWRDCLASLRDLSDALYLRFDMHTGTQEMLEALPGICGDKLKDVYVDNRKWNRWNWREVMIRMLDAVCPDVVLCPDQDEKFGEGIHRDLLLLSMVPRKALVFDYEMRTEDGAAVPKYPRRPHMKAYKWEPGITYIPYRGFANVSNFGKRTRMLAESKIQHFCFWSRELRIERGVDNPQKENPPKQTQQTETPPSTDIARPHRRRLIARRNEARIKARLSGIPQR